MKGSEHDSDKIHPVLKSDRVGSAKASRISGNDLSTVPLSFARELAEIPSPQHKCYECYQGCCGDFLGCIGIMCSCCKNCSPYIKVPQGYAGIQKRFGKAYRIVDPGLYYVNPLCEDMSYVNIKVHITDVPKQMVTTKDNVPIHIDSVVYWHIIDPFVAAFHIAKIELALQQRTMSTLRDTVGEYNLQDVLENRNCLLYTSDAADE
eukprot:TRINITY_DN7844_c0_g1_i9.p1 TRINITY_DN7844_c0_g1~~TRINITY_DN7844_c0_g1_i9.p1  ORF type:complete len:206 (+),score=46.02 TRINITY_DN7844_c0_g1_i9:156-773(+)